MRFAFGFALILLVIVIALAAGGGSENQAAGSAAVDMTSATSSTSHTTTLSCAAGQFMCKDLSGCIKLKDVCDGSADPDCLDGSDEDPNLCSTPTTSGTTTPLPLTTSDSGLVCGPREWMCADGAQCIKAKDFCDALDDPDCNDGSDESYCCTCSNGVAAVGEACPVHLSEVCTTCNEGYRLLGSPAHCAANVCSCPNGVAATGFGCASDGGVGCTSCNAGYYVTKDGRCELNRCDCPDGVGINGTGCVVSGLRACDSCNAGFRLVGSSCDANTCFCQDGVGIVGPGCRANGANACSSCHAGWHLTVGQSGTPSCSPNTCSCAHGTATTASGTSPGTLCDTDGANDCSACAAGHHIDGAGPGVGMQSCVPNECTCDDGTATTADGAGASLCGVHNTSDCMECTPGHHLSSAADVGQQTCLSNECTCTNGIPAVAKGDSASTLCEAHSASDCSACVDGFHLSASAGTGEQTCLANECSCSGGTGPTGPPGCGIHKSSVDVCVSCNTGFTLTGTDCVANACACANGIGVVGTGCAMPGGTYSLCLRSVCCWLVRSADTALAG